jgi:hypothetical protein
MKQRLGLSGCWIRERLTAALKAVAESAGQAEVVQFAKATRTDGHDVVSLEWVNRKLFRRTAIGARSVIDLSNLSAQRGWQRRAHSGSVDLLHLFQMV